MKFQQLASIPFVMGIMIQTGGAYDLLISTNRFDVLFEGPPIPEALQTFIVADIQRCYDVWGTNVTIEPGFPGRYGPYITRNVFGGPYSDETIDFPRLLTTNALGQLALKISPRLVQKYAEASAFKSNHLEKVLAADAFVDFLSSQEFANVTSNEVSNYILYKDLSPEGYLKSGEGIVKDLTSQEFYRPSILGFYYSPDGPAPTNLCALLSTIAKERTPSSCYHVMHVMPAIWHDGKWKINMWDWE